MSDDLYARLRSLVQAHCRRRPLTELQDVYKLLYQASLGIGHFLVSEEGVLSSLRRELAQTPDPAELSSSEGELLWESISPMDAVGRVNLRPFKDRGLDCGALARGLTLFASDPPGDVRQLAYSWSVLGDLIREGALPFRPEDYRQFTERILRDNYPAIHHSRAYAAAYRPAYRILSTRLFSELFPGAR